MHEGFIGRDEPVPAAEQVALQHALHRVLAEHLHNAAVGREFASVGIFRERLLRARLSCSAS